MISRVDTQDNIISLTLDADMDHDTYSQMTADESRFYNSRIIDLLKNTDTPATIFLTGLWILSHPNTSKDLANHPLFELGNHSFSHPDFSSPCFQGQEAITREMKIEEISKTQILLNELTGKKTGFFRFPNGCYSQSDLFLLRSLGLIPIQWSAYGPDTLDRSPADILDNLKSLTAPGAIIVLHLHGEDSAPHTASVLAEYIPWARSRGFRFVKLSDLLQSQR